VVPVAPVFHLFALAMNGDVSMADNSSGTTPQPRRRWVTWLAILSTVGMFIVIVMGSTVTGTGSGDGCGDSWPLCHGQFIPEYTVAAAIEYSHRLVSGIEGLLMIGFSIGALVYWRWRKEVKILVPVMMFFLLLQAGLGALAVMYPNSDEVLALHFGISLTAFASVLLLAVVIYEMGTAEKYRDRPVPKHFKTYLWGVVVYIYALVYVGAYVRHTQSSLACIDWPLCNGAVWPGFSGAVGIQFGHRLMALGGMLLIAGLVYWTWRFRSERPDLFWASVVSFALVIILAISGGIVVLSQLNLFSGLTHAGLATLLFGALSYIVLHVLPNPAEVREPAKQSATAESQESARGELGVSTPGD
jgi:heme a synthase